MDFMNLNQSAHGGREFGFICARLRLSRKVVVGHWQDAAVQRRARRLEPRGRRAARLRRLPRIARLGDNMREVAVTEGDKVAAQLKFGFAVNGYGVGDLVERVNDATDSQVDTLCAEYDEAYDDGRRRCEQDGERRESLRDAARIELGLRAFLEVGRLCRLHRHVRGPARPEATARHRGPAADGRRLRLRRRGRLEGGRPDPRREGDGRGAAGRHLVHGGLHLPLLAERRPGPRRPHAGDLPLDRRGPADAARSTRWASAARRTRCGWCSTPPPGRR